MTARVTEGTDLPAQTPHDGPPSGADSDAGRELRREQAHLDRVLARLADLRAQAARNERASLASPVGESPQDVYERDVTVHAAAVRRADLDLAGEGLLFGRLDRADGAVLHVGRLGVRTLEQEPLVVDWRAPAAAAFYQATATERLGVVRRRTIVTARDTVRGVEDELLDPGRASRLTGTVVVGDGAFMAAVSRERGAHMRDIVATIQAEQDRAVRAPDVGALLVTGGPGTGKTAVALHRVAYLLYSRRDYYARRDVLVVGPSAVFVDYISRVLPALGETSVRLASIGALPELPGRYVATGHDVALVAAVKGSARMAVLLQRAVEHVVRSADSGGDLVVDRNGTTMRVRGSELLRLRHRLARSGRPHNAGRSGFVDAAAETVWRAWTRRSGSTRLEADDRAELRDWLRDHDGFRRRVDQLWPVVHAAQVFSALRTGSLLWDRWAKDIFEEHEIVALRDAWEAAAGQDGVTAGDAAVLDELRALLGSPPEPEPDDDEDTYLDDLAEATAVTTFADRSRRPPADEAGDDISYAHVVVDEAQDVTPMQWRMLARRAGGATWTVVGDWAQSAWPDLDELRAAMSAGLGRARVREATLSTNYRTSAEIAELAAVVLAEIDPAARAPAAVRSNGRVPVLRGGLGHGLPDAVARAVDELSAQVSGTIGVICPYDAVEGVRGLLEAGLRGGSRVSVLDPWAVKGLEFDACVVVSPEAILAEGITRTAGLRSLYVALTRATQSLTVLSAEGLPAPLA